MPVKNTDQHVVGMLFMGRPRADVMNHIMHNIYLVSLSIVTIMIIAIIVSYYYSKKTIFALNTTKHFLGAVANGDLTTEIDPYVLQRHDEIGDMGRFAVMMKESLSDLVGKDPLTGLHNRHSCDVVLASLIQRVKQKNTSFAVAMGDVDFLNMLMIHMVIKQVTKLYVNLLKLFRPIWNTWDLYLDGVVKNLS